MSKETIKLTIAQNLRRLRKKNGMTMGILAERLGISYQQVQKYEKGINSIRSKKLFDLADMLHCGINDFYQQGLTD